MKKEIASQMKKDINDIKNEVLERFNLKEKIEIYCVFYIYL